MSTVRIALANLPFPASPEDSLARAEQAIAQAADRGAAVVLGTLLCHQPNGQAGLLLADLDLDQATGLLARRCRA
jgi:predicted amidohydrolase